MYLPPFSSLFAVLLALGAPQPVVDDGTARQARTGGDAGQNDISLSDRSFQWDSLIDPAGTPVAHQVHIERRVILRISPQPSNVRRSMFSELPAQPAPVRVVERPFGKCVDAGDIVGVSDRGSRLLMYMRDRKVISAKLEKACSPRDFYLGFYVERSEDGKLCVYRDRLLSRAGAKCRIDRFNRLVAVSEER